MDFPADVVTAQLAQEWDVLMRTLRTDLTWLAALGALGLVIGGLVAESGRAFRLRRFWCPVMGRDVQVLLEEAGFPGFRQVLGVKECSAFEPGQAITCRRACRDATNHKVAAPMGLAGILAARRGA